MRLIYYLADQVVNIFLLKNSMVVKLLATVLRSNEHRLIFNLARLIALIGNERTSDRLQNF